MYNIIHCVADKCTSALHKALTMITGGISEKLYFPLN